MATQLSQLKGRLHYPWCDLCHEPHKNAFTDKWVMGKHDFIKLLRKHGCPSMKDYLDTERLMKKTCPVCKNNTTNTIICEPCWDRIQILKIKEGCRCETTT